MASVVYQNATRVDDKVEVVAKVGDINHRVVVPASSLKAKAEQGSVTEEEALYDFLHDRFDGHIVTPPAEAFQEELKGHIHGALEVHEGNLRSNRRSRSSNPGAQRSEQRRDDLAAGVADGPRPVPAGNRRRVVARKQARHG